MVQLIRLPFFIRLIYSFLCRRCSSHFYHSDFTFEPKKQQKQTNKTSALSPHKERIGVLSYVFFVNNL